MKIGLLLVMTALTSMAVPQMVTGDDHTCDAILRDGIRNKYHLTQKLTQDSRFDDYKNLSRIEFQDFYNKSLKEGSATADVYFVFGASGGFKATDESYKSVIKKFNEVKSSNKEMHLAFDMSLYTETVDQTLVRAWQACLKEHAEALGLKVEEKQPGDGTASIIATWRPRDVGSPPIITAATEYVNAEAETGAPKEITSANTEFHVKLKDKAKAGVVLLKTKQGDYAVRIPPVTSDSPQGVMDEIRWLRAEVAQLRKEARESSTLIGDHEIVLANDVPTQAPTLFNVAAGAEGEVLVSLPQPNARLQKVWATVVRHNQCLNRFDVLDTSAGPNPGTVRVRYKFSDNAAARLHVRLFYVYSAN